MLKNIGLSVLLALGLNANTPVWSQPVQLPFDTSINTGKLSNGLTYFIQKNTEPKNRATMYLVVKAGSILETDGQQGLAHFMEHMSFNGTEHFPKNQLIDYLQKSGIRFGADLNAYTGFDETVYQLPIPTDKPDILQHGLQILRDWAQSATLEASEIERERGVVLEERRLGMGAEQRLQEKTLPVLLNGSLYAGRLPIGTERVLKSFRPETIRAFYRDWYRPDLQAVIVVGDVDVAAIEGQVRKLFADLKMPLNPKARKDYSIKLNGKNNFLVVTDLEWPQTSVGVSIKQISHATKTLADLDMAFKRNLFSQMFAQRLSDAGKRPDAPFMAMQGGYGELLGGLDALSINLVAKKGLLETGFKAMWREIERVRRFGFATSELERAKIAFSSMLEANLREKDKQQSTALADQLKNYFLKGKAVLGIEKETVLSTKLLHEIGLGDVNGLAGKLLKNTDRDIIISAPHSESGLLPTAAEVNSWIVAVQGAELEPFAETFGGKELIADLPLPGKIVAETRIPEIGVTEWKLSNGAKVVAKPTDFKHDEINFLAISPGGTSLYGEKDFQSAANAAKIISSFGLGAFDNVSLPRMLTGKQVSVSPFISERYEGMQGGSSVKDLKTAMELMRLYFTSPRRDTALFRKLMQNASQQIASRYADPNAVFADTVSAVMGDYNVRKTGPNLQKLKEIDVDRSFDIFKERFADAGGFTFFFTGSLDVDSLKNYVTKYLANLPGLGSVEEAKDLGLQIPIGQLSKTVMAGSEDKATVKMVFSGDFRYNAETNLVLTALQEILNYRLTERLRETEGGVYTPNAQVSKSKYPASRYTLTVNFGCKPSNAEKLIAATLDEFRKLRENGVSASDLQKFKAEQMRQRELLLKDNGFWLGYLSGQYLDGEDPKALLQFDKLLENLDLQTLHNASKQYLTEKNYIRFVLLPNIVVSKANK